LRGARARLIEALVALATAQARWEAGGYPPCGTAPNGAACTCRYTCRNYYLRTRGLW
jgi:hypothetical protein